MSKRKRQTSTTILSRKYQCNEISQTMASIDNFAEEFQSFSSAIDQDNIAVDEFNCFVSVSCFVCKLIKTQH